MEAVIFISQTLRVCPLGVEHGSCLMGNAKALSEKTQTTLQTRRRLYFTDPAGLSCRGRNTTNMLVGHAKALSEKNTNNPANSATINATTKVKAPIDRKWALSMGLTPHPPSPILFKKIQFLYFCKP